MACRRVLCEAYPKCLQNAARSGAGFDCAECSRYKSSAYPERVESLCADLDGCRRLWLAVVYPDLFELLKTLEGHSDDNEKRRLLRSALDRLKEARRGHSRGFG